MIDKRTKNAEVEAEEVVACCGFDSAKLEAYTSEQGKNAARKMRSETQVFRPDSSNEPLNKNLKADTWLYTGCDGIARPNEWDNVIGI